MLNYDLHEAICGCKDHCDSIATYPFSTPSCIDLRIMARTNVAGKGQAARSKSKFSQIDTKGSERITRYMEFADASKVAGKEEDRYLQI